MVGPDPSVKDSRDSQRRGMTTPAPGDSVIIHRAQQVFDVIDVEINEIIARCSTLREALAIAAQNPGHVWQQNVDRYGQYGEPILVLLRRKR